MSEPLLLTVEQVADLLQVSRWWIYDHGRELGLIKLGSVNRYPRQRVEEYVAERIAEVEAPSSPPAPVAPLRVVPPEDRTPPRRRPRRVPLLEPGGRAA